MRHRGTPGAPRVNDCPLLMAASTLEPQWALPFANRGNVCRARGDNQAAIRAYSRAIELDPLFVPAWVNFSDLMRMRQREPDAEALLRIERQIRRGPPSARVERVDAMDEAVSDRLRSFVIE